MEIYIIIAIRIIHIFSGVLWVGGTIFFLFLIRPTIKSLGDSGEKFMKHLVNRQRYPIFIGVAAMSTVISGAMMYWGSSGGLQLAWIKTGPGLGFTIGSIFGIFPLLMGMFLMNPIDKKISALWQEIDTAGGKANTSQSTELQQLDGRLASIERVEFVFLTISLLAMASARFWTF